jgi:hypothetical protein
MSRERKSRGLFKFLATMALLDIAWLVFTSSSEMPIATSKIRICLTLVICVVSIRTGK